MPSNPALKILAFDTSSARGSAALLEGKSVVAELRLFAQQTHSARLLRSMAFLLDTAGWKLHELNLVAVGMGPGSFTGIRIGAATALGIAQSLSIPFCGISGLDALAHEVSFLNGRIGILMDAQRSQTFYAEYISKEGRIRAIGKSLLLQLSDLQHRLAGKHMYVIGDIAEHYIQRYKSSPTGWPRLINIDWFLAAGIGRLAYSRKRSWRSNDFLKTEPLYIRPPDAYKAQKRTN